MAVSSVFTQDEVVIHNSWYDIWVIVNGRVFDLTNLIKKRLNELNDVSWNFFFEITLVSYFLLESLFVDQLSRKGFESLFQ